MSPSGRYAPVGDYALIGDGQGCGLIGRDGSVDWLAVPVVDAPPLLARTLDAEQGGWFRIRPMGESTSSRRYLEGTMVLETTFETPTGVMRVTDALTVGFRGVLPWSELARRVEVLEGTVAFEWELRPGSRLSSVRPWVHWRDGTPFVLAGDLLSAVVTESAGEPQVDQSGVRASSSLDAGQRAMVTLVSSRDAPLLVSRAEDVQRRLDHTVDTWRNWSDLIDYEGPFREQLRRSVLVLRTLSNTRTGALAAAPTTSFPEVVGEQRNFDYRFGWVRDSSFMLDAFAGVGLSEEVDASLGWLLSAVARTAPDVRVFYKLDGTPATGEEQKIELLEGYRGSRPVTVGNKAAVQRQIGAYGDLFGAVSRHVRQGAHLDTSTALMLAQLADQVCDEWPLTGAGIWELGEEHNYTSSLISSWAALHLACQLVDQGQIPDTHVLRWRQAADAVHAWTDEHCWSEAKGSYTFYAGTDDLDAAVLLAARTGFLPGDDPRLWSTIDAVRRELTAEGPWLYRYTAAAKEEHAFVCCTFWCVEALAHAGRVDEAGRLLEGALAGTNDLGLLSEEIDASSGELLGNFPLGLSHLTPVGAVTAYSRASGAPGGS